MNFIKGKEIEYGGNNMNSLSREGNLSQFPFERTADGRKRTVMGLSLANFDRIEVPQLPFDNVTVISKEDIEERFKRKNKGIAGMLRKIKLSVGRYIMGYQEPVATIPESFRAFKDRKRFKITFYG
jgi:hypothetical protein